MDQLSQVAYFPTHVYAIDKSEYLDAVKAVSDKYLEAVRKPSTMTTMTMTYSHEESIKD